MTDVLSLKIESSERAYFFHIIHASDTLLGQKVLSQLLLYQILDNCTISLIVQALLGFDDWRTYVICLAYRTPTEINIKVILDIDLGASSCIVQYLGAYQII